MSKFILSILIFSSFLFVFSSSAQNLTPDLQTVIKQLQDQIKLLNQQITELQSSLKETQKEVEIVKTELKLTRSLKKGESNEEVRQLQEFLKQFPDIYPEGIVTGFFGSLTETAVKRFQQKHGIESIGIVGPKTLEKLKEFSVSATPAILAIPAVPGISPAIPAIPAIPSIPASLSLPLQPASSSQPIVIPAIPAIPAVPGVSSAVPAVPAIPATLVSPSAVKTPTPTPTPTYNTRPVISSVSASSITSNSAVISWTTDVPATGFVNYGTPTIGIVTPENTSYLTSHSFTLSNLAAGALYNYRVYSHNAYGDQTDLTNGLPPNHTFTTLSGPVSCSSISLTLNDGKTTYIKGVDNVMNYTWTCIPGGSADVNIGIQKPDGWISLNTATNSSIQTLFINISGDSYPAGSYRLEACFGTCGSIVAGKTFTISSLSPAPTPTPTPTPMPISNKPATVTIEGADGTWCYDSDINNDRKKTKGYCQDNNGIYYDDCNGNTANDYTCNSYGAYDTYGKFIVNTTKCGRDEYTCGPGSILGNTCSEGICIFTSTPVPTASVSFSPSVPATANILDALKAVLQNLNNLLFQLR